MKRLIRGIGGVLLMLTVLAGGVSARASQGKGMRMPDLDGSKGTLTFHLGYTDREVTSDIQGAKFSLYLTAGLTVENGAARYALTGAYAGVSVNFEGMTASESIEAAQALAALAVSDTPVKEGTTDAEGKIVFDSLEAGMYLLIQTGSTGAAAGYEAVSPFLVAVPLGETGEGDSGTWNYQVQAEPKTEVKKQPTTEPQSETQPITETETQSETEPITETETQSETEPITETETQSETEPITETETESETQPATETETESETQPATETETESETQPATETETQSETQPATGNTNGGGSGGGTTTTGSSVSTGDNTNLLLWALLLLLSAGSGVIAAARKRRRKRR